MASSMDGISTGEKGVPPDNHLRRLGAVRSTSSKPRPNLILAVACSATLLDLSNLSAVTIALPTIGEQFHIDQAQLQWVISAYALTFGSFLLLGGRGGDVFGHRRVLLFGSCFFALFTLISALAPNFISLVIARAFQGIGAGLTIPSAQAHIAIYFPAPADKAKALGLWGAASSIGFITGLILGGVLTPLLSWRWIFWISLMLSGLVVIGAYLVLPSAARSQSKVHGDLAIPESRPTGSISGNGSASTPTSMLQMLNTRMARFDVVGIPLGLPGLLLLTYALTSANTIGWGSTTIISTLVISVLLLSVFIFWESRASQPLLNTSLFHDLTFSSTLIIAAAIYAVRQACSYFLTLQLQSYNSSPLHTAILFLPAGVSALITNTIAGRLVPIFGVRAMFLLGWALCIPGVVFFSFVTPTSSYWHFAFPGLILYIAELGTACVAANVVAVSSASKSEQGAVAGMFNVALQIGGSVLGLSVLTAVANGIDKRYGHSNADTVGLTEIGYKSVYYSCVCLCGISFLLSLIAIRGPTTLAGSIWKNEKAEKAVDGKA